MTVIEAAEYLRASRQRVDDILSARRFTRVKEGRRTLMARSGINAYLKRPEVVAALSPRDACKQPILRLGDTALGVVIGVAAAACL